MVKIQIDEAEWFPCYTLEENSLEFHDFIPTHTISKRKLRQLKKAQGGFEKAQAFLYKLYSKERV